MTRRRVVFFEELPFQARRRLWAVGVRITGAQAWLDARAYDGCTLGPDLYLAVCGMHDYLVRTGVVRRWWADDWARDTIAMLALARAKDAWADEDELVWRLLAAFWCLLGVAYAPLFWCGVVLGDWLGIGAPDRVP